jgi:hypothetical protein
VEGIGGSHAHQNSTSGCVTIRLRFKIKITFRAVRLVLLS